jgi:hypothetical protein
MNENAAALFLLKKYIHNAKLWIAAAEGLIIGLEAPQRAAPVVETDPEPTLQGQGPLRASQGPLNRSFSQAPVELHRPAGEPWDSKESLIFFLNENDLDHLQNEIEWPKGRPSKEFLKKTYDWVNEKKEEGY